VFFFRQEVHAFLVDLGVEWGLRFQILAATPSWIWDRAGPLRGSADPPRAPSRAHRYFLRELCLRMPRIVSVDQLGQSQSTRHPAGPPPTITTSAGISGCWTLGRGLRKISIKVSRFGLRELMVHCRTEFWSLPDLLPALPNASPIPARRQICDFAICFSGSRNGRLRCSSHRELYDGGSRSGYRKTFPKFLVSAKRMKPTWTLRQFLSDPARARPHGLSILGADPPATRARTRAGRLGRVHEHIARVLSQAFSGTFGRSRSRGMYLALA